MNSGKNSGPYRDMVKYFDSPFIKNKNIVDQIAGEKSLLMNLNRTYTSIVCN